MKRLVKRFLGLAALVVCLSAASGPDIDWWKLFGFVPCCQGQVCEPNGCWFHSDCNEDGDCLN